MLASSLKVSADYDVAYAIEVAVTETEVPKNVTDSSVDNGSANIVDESSTENSLGSSTTENESLRSVKAIVICALLLSVTILMAVAIYVQHKQTTQEENTGLVDNSSV